MLSTLPVYVEYIWYILSLCMLSMFGILYYYYWMLSCMGPVLYVRYGWYVLDPVPGVEGECN